MQAKGAIHAGVTMMHNVKSAIVNMEGYATLTLDVILKNVCKSYIKLYYINKSLTIIFGYLEKSSARGNSTIDIIGHGDCTLHIPMDTTKQNYLHKNLINVLITIQT